MPLVNLSSHKWHLKLKFPVNVLNFCLGDFTALRKFAPAVRAYTVLTNAFVMPWIDNVDWSMFSTNQTRPGSIAKFELSPCSHNAGGILKTALSLWKRIKCFTSTLTRRRTLVILYVFLINSRSGNPHTLSRRHRRNASCFTCTFKTQSRRFQIPSVWWPFSETCV